MYCYSSSSPSVPLITNGSASGIYPRTVPQIANSVQQQHCQQQQQGGQQQSCDIFSSPHLTPGLFKSLEAAVVALRVVVASLGALQQSEKDAIIALMDDLMRRDFTTMRQVPEKFKVLVIEVRTVCPCCSSSALLL